VSLGTLNLANQALTYMAAAVRRRQPWKPLFHAAGWRQYFDEMTSVRLRRQFVTWLINVVIAAFRQLPLTRTSDALLTRLLKDNVYATIVWRQKTKACVMLMPKTSNHGSVNAKSRRSIFNPAVPNENRCHVTSPTFIRQDMPD
jgi:hypothetical protein